MMLSVAQPLRERHFLRRPMAALMGVGAWVLAALPVAAQTAAVPVLSTAEFQSCLA